MSHPRLDALRARRAAKHAADRLADRKAEPGPSANPPARTGRERIAQLRDRKRDTGGGYADVRRICALPIIDSMEGVDLEAWQREHVLAPALRKGFRLWPIQAQAIQAYKDVGGAFCPIGVGWGKTLCTLAAAHWAREKGLRKVALFVPSQVLPQLTGVDIPAAAQRIPMGYQIHVLGGRDRKTRRLLAQSDRSGLYIIPYSLLSQPDAEDNLRRIQPELLICDEADNLGNRKAARTRRVMHFIDEFKPEGVCLSGTITSKTISDYHHLIRWCLDRACPLPISSHLVREWGALIDSGASIGAGNTAAILPLVEWAQRNFPAEQIKRDTKGFRDSYRLRLHTCPGVAATSDTEIGASLVFYDHSDVKPEGVEGAEEMQRLIDQVTDAWLTPNGDEIEYAIHTFKWLYELSSGCYNQLAWPEPEVLAKRERMSRDEATELLDMAQQRHAVRQVYAKTLRDWLATYGRRNLDTPMLVGASMAQHGASDVGQVLYSDWCALKDWDERLFDLRKRVGRPLSEQETLKRIAQSFRDSSFIRVCPYKVDFAVKWARGLKKGEGGVVWVMNEGMGVWAFEALVGAGVDALYCPAGKESNVTIIDPENASKVVVASMSAHGVGKNLQHWHRQLFLQWPRAARLAEQVLGRLHRNGQRADTVWAHTVCSTEFDNLCRAATLVDALYIHQTTGVRQKLIYGTYSPKLPTIFPFEVLRERGFQNQSLTADQVKALAERFGTSDGV